MWKNQDSNHVPRDRESSQLSLHNKAEKRFVVNDELRDKLHVPAAQLGVSWLLEMLTRQRYPLIANEQKILDESN